MAIGWKASPNGGGSYVFPAEINFWAGILRQQGPVPDPWKKFTGEILEGLVMVQAAVNVGDPQIRARLYQEGVAKVSAGAHSLANAKVEA